MPAECFLMNATEALAGIYSMGYVFVPNETQLVSSLIATVMTGNQLSKVLT